MGAGSQAVCPFFSRFGLPAVLVQKMSSFFFCGGAMVAAAAQGRKLRTAPACVCLPNKAKACFADFFSFFGSQTGVG